MILKNILITVDKKNISIIINDKSDLTMAFSIIKSLLKWTDCIPQSIYILNSDNSKIKNSINRFKNYDLWDFLDNREQVETSSNFESGSYSKNTIVGWEVRFLIEINETDMKNKIKEINDGYEGLIKKLKNKTNDL